MISKKFVKSSVIYTLAGSLPMASGIILLPFYVHFLPTDQLGALSIYMAFSMLVQIIITYSFDTSLYIHFHEYKKDPQKLAEFVGSAFVFILLASAAVALFMVTAGGVIFNTLFEEKHLSFFPYGLIAVITAVFQAFFKVQNSLFQSREKPEVYLWSNLVLFALTAGLTIGGFYWQPGTLVGPMGGRMVASIVVGGWTLFRIFGEFGVHFNYTLLRKSFGYNNPSFIYQLQQWSVNYLDRFIMLFYLDLDQVGVYDFAIKCMLVIDILLGGIYNSFYPKIISEVMEQEVKQSSIRINRYYHGLTACAMLLVCFATLGFSVLIDSGLMRSGYEETARYIPLIGIYYLVRSMRYYFVFPYGALKFSRPLPVIYLAIVAIKIGLMILFMPRFGLYAVVGASTLSTAVEVLLLRIALKERFKFKFNAFKLIFAPLILGAFIAATYVLTNVNHYIIELSSLVVCVAVLWTLYKNELKLLKPFSWIR